MGAKKGVLDHCTVALGAGLDGLLLATGIRRL